MTKIWGWRPELGRWQMERFGYPDLPTYIAISTASIPTTSSYDYWRDIAFSDFEANRLDADAAKAFQAKASGLTSRRADFFVATSNAVSGERSQSHIDRDGLDSISIGLVTRGQRVAQQRDGSQQRARPGELFAYDAARPSTVSWTNHDTSYLVIRRGDLMEALGASLPDPADLTRRLAASPMRQLVVDQLRSMVRYHDTLDAAAQAFLLDQAVQLTLFALARRSPNGQPMVADQTLFRTALRLIHADLANPALDADRLARALGVSRATLYRAFATEGIAVAETIRNLRLDRARHLLETARPEMSIAEIALNCGLYDTANFSRLFRQRFGASPSQLRGSAGLSPP